MESTLLPITSPVISPVLKQFNSYFPALTGLRALAAYAVFWFHCNPLKPGGIPWKIVNEGYIGVTVFFVLSGFLICLRYANRIEISREWVGKYIRNRFARIYPMYFLITGLTFLILSIDHAYDVGHQWQGQTGVEKGLVLFLNASLLKAFFQHFIYTGISQGWTLTVEECFYLTALFMLLGISKSTKRYALLALYGLGLLIIGCAIVGLVPHPFGFFESYRFMLKFTFFGHCIEFLSGMGLALFLLKRPIIAKSSSLFTWVGSIWIVIAVLALSQITNTSNNTMESVSFISIFINNVLLPPGIILLFYGLIHEQSWLRRLLETPLLSLMGKSSYVFYLIHIGVISFLIDRYISINYFIHFPLIVALSIILFHFVENPLHKRIAHSLKKA